MSSSDPETYDLVAQTDAAYRRMLDYWDSKINEASGTFEAVFGDPSQTPCTSALGTCIHACPLLGARKHFIRALLALV